MTRRFYDKQDDCIRDTAKTYEHYKNHFYNLYFDFFDYMESVFPDFVWIED